MARSSVDKGCKQRLSQIFISIQINKVNLPTLQLYSRDIMRIVARLIQITLIHFYN